MGNILPTEIATKLFKIIASFLLFSIISLQNVHAAEQAETARLVEQLRPPPKVTEKDRIYVENYYEPSQVLEGNQTGQWWENTTAFGYSHKNITGYGAISQFRRLGILDYTANFGSYINIDKDQYAHMEVGYGWDVDYIYKLQVITEYAHRLYKDLFCQLGYSYRGYPSGDSHILYPGLVYYLGDSWMSATFGTNWIEGRENAYFGTIKGNFVITDRVQFWTGVAFGQRLYDIFGIKNENGFIIFGGITINIYKGINLRIGGSYGDEEPKFIKRSLIFDTSVKF